jgi:hypothetical protein
MNSKSPTSWLFEKKVTKNKTTRTHRSSDSYPPTPPPPRSHPHELGSEWVVRPLITSCLVKRKREEKRAGACTRRAAKKYINLFACHLAFHHHFFFFFSFRDKEENFCLKQHMLCFPRPCSRTKNYFSFRF